MRGRCLLLKACFDECALVFMNTYASINGAERKIFREKVNTRLDCCGSEEFWDFNCTEYELDHNHGEPHPDPNTLHSNGLVDVWRRIHADCCQYICG